MPAATRSPCLTGVGCRRIPFCTMTVARDMHRRRFIVLVLLAAAMAFRVLFLVNDVHTLVDRGPLYDDSFYAFGVARHIAAGLGSTFDLEHPTNGFQPLWVGALVPLYWLAPGNGPIYLALVLAALLNVLTGWLLYRILRRQVGFAACVLALVLWGFAPAVVRQAVNGLETSLAMFLVALAVDYYSSHFRARPGRRQALTLGVLLGLAVLARVDAVLFVAALAWDGWRQRQPWRAWALCTGVIVGMLLPWGIVSTVTVGRVTPESGEATRLLSVAYAAHDFPDGAATGRGVTVHTPLWVNNLGQSFLLLGIAPALHVFTRALERALDLVGAAPHWRTVAIGMFIAAVLTAAFLLLRPRLRRLYADLGFMGVYCVLLVLAYSCVVFGHIFFSRYYVPIFFFSIVVAAHVADALLAHVAPRRRRAVALAVVAVYAGLLPYMSWNRLRNGNYHFVNVVHWIESQTPPASRFGIFNSGAIGYFSSRRVLNLDGKVNPQALAALRRGDLRAYIVAAHIDYVIDHGWILDRFLRPTDQGDDLRFVRVAGEEDLGVPGWCAYRVQPLHTGAASSLLP